MAGGPWALPPTDAHLNSISIEYTYEDLAEATSSFASPNKLGHGTYGAVYRGTLRDGTEVAVKVLREPKEQGFREEVEVLSKFRHPNLVILMGFARRGKERYLIYELLAGGDVCSRLQGGKEYVWTHRIGTALDAALGLSHLHFSRPQVFHRDIKTQNILLDKNGTGKMADFGLACLAQPDCEALRVEHTSGTIGYADPLYIHTSVVTEKSEVYSFGMVMLELLTGRPPALQHASGRIEYQFGHINGDIRNVYPMVDQRGRWPPHAVQYTAQMALRCIDESEGQRPSFIEIVKELRQWLRDAESGATPAPAPTPAWQRMPAASPNQPSGYGGYGHQPVSASPSRPTAEQRAPSPQQHAQQQPIQPMQPQHQPMHPVQPQPRDYGPSGIDRGTYAIGSSSNPFAGRAWAEDRGPAAQAFGGAPYSGTQHSEAAAVGSAAFVGFPHNEPTFRPANFAEEAARLGAGGRMGAPVEPQQHAYVQPRPQAQQPLPHFPGAHEGAGHNQGQAAPPEDFDEEELQRAIRESEQLHEHPPPRAQDNEQLVNQVMDLGFDRKMAEEALKRCSTAEAAIAWILDQ